MGIINDLFAENLSIHCYPIALQRFLPIQLNPWKTDGSVDYTVSKYLRSFGFEGTRVNGKCIIAVHPHWLNTVEQFSIEL